MPSERPWKFRTPLSVGAMNDGLFVIDAPPSPSGSDVPVDTPHDVNVICKVTEELEREAHEQLSNLFSAAPELYEALEEIVQALDDGGAFSLDRAQAALAKALPKEEGGKA